MKQNLKDFSDEERDIANTHIGRLHSRIHTLRLLNYYEEKSQDYDKVVEAFIRANTGGKKLEYSDILLSTATEKWNTLNAREEIYNFTDNINTIGNGYSFEKDFVLKGCLYLTDNLPIQYKVKNLNKENLERIEENWENIKINIEDAIKLVNKFGFNDKNLVAKMSILPVALYLKKLNRKNFVDSTDKSDVENQIFIQKWLTLVLLKNSFGGSSDSTLRNLQEVIANMEDVSRFPYQLLNKKLNIEDSFSDNEIDNLLSAHYSTKYSYLILSLLYPDRDWKDKIFNEDHIYPKSEFTNSKLKQRGYSNDLILEYQKNFNSILNLELLTESENKEKNAEDFDKWLKSRDTNFKKRHFIPEIESYSFNSFINFICERKKLLQLQLKNFSI